MRRLFLWESFVENHSWVDPMRYGYNKWILGKLIWKKYADIVKSSEPGGKLFKGYWVSSGLELGGSSERGRGQSLGWPPWCGVRGRLEGWGSVQVLWGRSGCPPRELCSEEEEQVGAEQWGLVYLLTWGPCHRLQENHKFRRYLMGTN